jgi:G3E family GTPase
MVTVVDAGAFLDEWAAADGLIDRGMALNGEDERTVVDLLVDQVEFANVIVVNKIDRVDTETAEALEAVLRQLNPKAAIVRAERGVVPLDQMLNTGRFDMTAASQAPGWLAVMRGEEVPESEEYGIRSFVYRARRPFHPERFWNLIHDDWPGVFRSKGFFWLASKYVVVGEWSQAGGACSYQPAGLWWADIPTAEWPTDTEALEDIGRHWRDDIGDRRQEIVIIGREMDETVLTARLDACLLTDDEMALGREAWEAFEDPFPAWKVATEADVETVAPA